MTIVAVGDVSLKVELDLREEEPRARFGIEGAATDVALAAVRLGTPARLIGTVYRDHVAERLKEVLARVEGLEAYLIVQEEEPRLDSTGWWVRLWPDDVDEHNFPPGLDLTELHPEWLEGAHLVHLTGRLTSRAEPGPMRSLRKQAQGQAPSACPTSVMETEEGCLAWFKERREQHNRRIFDDILAFRDRVREQGAAFSLELEALPWGVLDLIEAGDGEAREVEKQLRELLEGVDFLLASRHPLLGLAYTLGEGRGRGEQRDPARWLFELAQPKLVVMEGGVGDRYALEAYEGGDRVLTLELPRRPWREHQRLLRTGYTALALARLRGLAPESEEAANLAKRALELVPASA
jgi:hypothetical protein